MTFGAGTEFADNQSFTAGMHKRLVPDMTFGTGTEFADNQSLRYAQTFGSGMTFGAGAEFADNQSFTAGTHAFGA